LGAVHVPVPSSTKPCFAGSVPVRMVVPLRVAAFHVPKTAVGEIAVPPNCQSWQRDGVGSDGVQMTAGAAVMSVRNSEGKNGRPDGSVAVRSPTCGLRTKDATFPGAG